MKGKVQNQISLTVMSSIHSLQNHIIWKILVGRSTRHNTSEHLNPKQYMIKKIKTGIRQYIIHTVYYTYSILYIQYTIYTVYYTYSILYIHYIIHTVYYTYSILYIQYIIHKYIIHTVYYTFSILYIQYIIHTVYYTYSILYIHYIIHTEESSKLEGMGKLRAETVERLEVETMVGWGRG
jgi:hypothetical protein